jgi:hypothetical protein
VAYRPGPVVGAGGSGDDQRGDAGVEPARPRRTRRYRPLNPLRRYAALHDATGLDHWVLFWLSTPGREASLRHTLARHPAITSGRLLVGEHVRRVGDQRDGLGEDSDDDFGGHEHGEQGQ